MSSNQALAATPTIIRNNEPSAMATWPGPVGQFQLSDILLLVDKSSAGTDIQLLYTTPTIQAGNGFAEITTTDNVFQITGLNSATLSPVTLTACVSSDGFGNCNQFAPITIQAEWTGFGTVTLINFQVHSGTTTVKVMGTGKHAIATGTLNLQNLGQSSSAFILNSKELCITTIQNIC